MKKKTVITTETREVWVIRQAFGVEVLDWLNSESESSSESLILHIDQEAKKGNDSPAESTTQDVQE